MSSSELDDATARWRLDLAYDGAAFAGFAPQPGRETVVGALGGALERTLRLGAPPFIVGAGRTDAGVHALAQVVSLDLPVSAASSASADHLVAALNGQLRGRAAVLRARVVDGFNARHDATWRAYRYLVTTGAPLGVTSRVAWPVSGDLDDAAMNDAAALVLGDHDFRAFCRRPADKVSSDPLVRHVLAASWRVEPDPLALSTSGAFFVFSIRANAFCHHQVRRLVGAFVDVGRGRLAITDLAARLESGDPAGLPAPAPAAGLALVGVGYDERHGGPSGRSTQVSPIGSAP